MELVPASWQLAGADPYPGLDTGLTTVVQCAMAPDTSRLPAYPPVESIPGLVPKPPTERGWREVDPEVDPCAVDATFENETRLHK